MTRIINYRFNRWIILIASCIINLCIGSVYAWSVFATPMAAYLTNETGTTVASLAIVFTVANSIGPITMISGGFINNKLGPRLLIMVGGILYGSGLILAGFSRSVGFLLFSYGIIAGFGLGFVYGCTISNAVKFFPDRKGFAGGMATASYGLSSVILPPIANSLIDRFSVTSAFRILGIAMLIIILVFSLFISKCPDEAVQPSPIDSGSAKIPHPGIATKDKNWIEMLKTPYFYCMMVMLCCGAFAGLMITSQASPMAQLILSANTSTAAIIVSILAFFNAGGRLLSGSISDKLGPRKTLRLVFILLIIGVVLLYLPIKNRTIPFYIGVIVIGLCFGSIMGIFPGFTTSQFGPKNNGTNYGIMFCGFALAGLLAPLIVSKLLLTTGSYQAAFIVSGVLAVIGLILTFFKSK